LRGELGGETAVGRGPDRQFNRRTVYAWYDRSLYFEAGLYNTFGPSLLSLTGNAYGAGSTTLPDSSAFFSGAAPVARSTIILPSWLGSRGRLGCLGYLGIKTARTSESPVHIGCQHKVPPEYHRQSKPLPLRWFQTLASFVGRHRGRQSPHRNRRFQLGGSPHMSLPYLQYGDASSVSATCVCANYIIAFLLTGPVTQLA
jgi:hypothetical protein